MGNENLWLPNPNLVGPPPPVFGQDYQTAVSVGRSTTTLVAFQTKTTLTTPALTGTYRVGWESVIDNEAVPRDTIVRLRNVTDGVTVGAERRIESDDVSNRRGQGGFDIIVFTGTAKTLEIQFATSAGGTAGIQDARIEIWRIS